MIALADDVNLLVSAWEHGYIHSFILDICIAPIQENYMYSEALPTP